MPKLIFYISETHLAREQIWRKKKGLEKKRLVGVHAGAGPLGERKKWGLENFAAELQEELRKDNDTRVIIFGGPEEEQEKKQLAGMLPAGTAFVYSGALKGTAALISMCDYFISNDTGLMHIAAAFGIRQKAIFVATNEIRTRPWNTNAEMIKVHTNIEFKYPFWSCR